MSPETRAFLDTVRHAEEPTPEDEARVLSAVRTVLAAGAGAGLVAGSAKASKLFGLTGFSGLKLGGVVVGLAASTWLAGALVPGQTSAPAPRSFGERAPGPAERPPERPEEFAAEPAPAVAPSEPSPAPAASANAAVRRPVPRAPESLREEIALLAEVQAALDRGDAAGALRSLDGHVTSDRQLAAERKAARIHALCALGRTGEARGLAAEFARAHPSSLQGAALERSCAGRAPAGSR